MQANYKKYFIQLRLDVEVFAQLYAVTLLIVLKAAELFSFVEALNLHLVTRLRLHPSHYVQNGSYNYLPSDHFQCRAFTSEH